jgi:hypothetical protein
MRGHAALATTLALAIGLFACGKYGPPERTVQRKSPAPAAAPEPVPWTPEVEIPEPAEFDEGEADQENDR